LPLIILAHEGNPVLHLLTIAPCGGVLKGDTTCCMEVLTMDFSLNDYLDEDACYTKPNSSNCSTLTAWPARAAESGNAWGSTAVIAPPWWTSSAALAAGSSTPSRGPPCRGPIAAPRHS